jgi:hypothetical protein
VLIGVIVPESYLEFIYTRKFSNLPTKPPIGRNKIEAKNINKNKNYSIRKVKKLKFQI